MRLPLATIVMRLDSLSDMQKLLIHPNFLNLDDDSKVIAFAEYAMANATKDRQTLYEVREYLEEIYSKWDSKVGSINTFRAYFDKEFPATDGISMNDKGCSTVTICGPYLRSNPEVHDSVYKGLINKNPEGLPNLGAVYTDIRGNIRSSYDDTLLNEGSKEKPYYAIADLEKAKKYYAPKHKDHRGFNPLSLGSSLSKDTTRGNKSPSSWGSSKFGYLNTEERPKNIAEATKGNRKLRDTVEEMMRNEFLREAVDPIKEEVQYVVGERPRKATIRNYIERLIRGDFFTFEDELFLKEVSKTIAEGSPLQSLNVPFALCMEADADLSDKEKIRLKSDKYNITRITIPRVTKKADALDVQVSYDVTDSNKIDSIKGFTRTIGNFYAEITKEKLEYALNRLDTPYELVYKPELSNDITKPLQTTIYVRYVKKDNPTENESAPFYTESELALTTKGKVHEGKSLFETSYVEQNRMGDEDLIKWYQSSQHVVKSLRSDENFRIIQELDILNETVPSYSVSNYNRKRPQLFSFGLLETFGYRADSLLKDFFEYIGLKGDIESVDNITRVKDANSVLENWIVLSDSQLKQIVYHPQLSHIDINKGAVLDPRFTRLYVRQRKDSNTGGGLCE